MAVNTRTAFATDALIVVSRRFQVGPLFTQVLLQLSGYRLLRTGRRLVGAARNSVRKREARIPGISKTKHSNTLAQRWLLSRDIVGDLAFCNISGQIRASPAAMY